MHVYYKMNLAIHMRIFQIFTFKQRSVCWKYYEMIINYSVDFKIYINTTLSYEI